MKEALMLALEALEKSTKYFNIVRLGESRLKDSEIRGASHAAITAIKEALAQPDYRAVKTYHEGKPVYVSQPEQEPVAWEVGVVNGVVTRRLASPASPPKRPWVGLTDEQREACTQSPFTEDNYDDIEAKLKELNT